MSTDSLLYTLVARGTNILAEHTKPGARGTFAQVSAVLLRKIPDRDDAMSYTYERHHFHYRVSSGITYLVLSEDAFPRSVAFAYLAEVQKRFTATYGDRALTAIAYSYNADFSNVLRALMAQFNAHKESDKISLVQDEIAQVRDVMVQSIDKVLERGEKVELLVDRSELLDAGAYKFKRQARTLRRKLWWKNVKLLILIFLVVAIVIYIILASSCGGFALPDC